MDCKRCNGIGHLSIMHDNDLTCIECGGTGEQPVTVATVEPLSAEAELRLQLAKLDQAYEDDDKDSFRRYHEAMFDITVGLSFNLHMLLDLLDAERKTNAALREQLKDNYFAGWNDGAEAYGS